MGITVPLSSGPVAPVSAITARLLHDLLTRHLLRQVGPEHDGFRRLLLDEILPTRFRDLLDAVVALLHLAADHLDHVIARSTLTGEHLAAYVGT